MDQNKIPKTSVVITTFNDAEYLKRSIPSVINQTSKPKEIIIIDDGSSDNQAKEIVDSFHNHTDIPIILNKKKNGGPSSARNVGIKLAKGEFILFLDADDELLKNSLKWREELLESLDQNYASIYCSKIKLIDNKRKIKEKIFETDGKLNVCLVGRNNGIPGQITHHLFRRDIVNEVNGYNESLRFNEDFEFLLRIAKKGLFFGVNRVGFIQHMREDSWSKSDPYYAYNGVEDFLNLASNKELLPQIEIKLRRKENRLSLAKVILFQRTKLKEAIPYIDEAFDIIKPQNIKEHALFYLNKTLKKL
tara:strand:+ start:17 stop:931 length:915 start_codon:yes stop_codon:yes gene_type:complete